jgi:hypothetical protein
MRQLVYILLVILLACQRDKDDWYPTIGPGQLTIKVKYDAPFQPYNLPLGNIPVIVKNTTRVVPDTFYTNNAGEIVVDSIAAGDYNFQTSRSFTASEYFNYTGLLNSIAFNDLLNRNKIGSRERRTIELTLRGSARGNLLIKQIYYAGSSVIDGASFRDQFIEIYNNTSDTIYADSLYIAALEGNSSLLSAIDYNQPSVLPQSHPNAGQWDWRRSLIPVGAPPLGANANDDFVYADNLYRIPGNGRQYPIAPYTSIIVAQSALNHKGNYVAYNGTTITVRDPSLTVDLNGAEFEVYLRGLIATPSPTDLDNPAPNMVMLKNTGTDLILDLRRSAYVIFKTRENVTAWPRYPNPRTTVISTNTQLFPQIPKRYITDAVEVQESPARLCPRKLSSDLDGGYTYVPGNNNSSQSVMRVTDSLVSGKRILRDNNNSTSDFEFRQRALPKGF